MNQILEYRNLTPEERLERVCDILVRGMYIMAEKKGWMKKPKSIFSNYPNCIKRHQDKSLYDIEEQAENNVTYTVKESAEMLKITKKTLLRWIKDGKVKTERQINGYHRIAQKELGIILAKRGV